jgi:hypothetical protein
VLSLVEPELPVVVSQTTLPSPALATEGGQNRLSVNGMGVDDVGLSQLGMRNQSNA